MVRRQTIIDKVSPFKSNKLNVSERPSSFFALEKSLHSHFSNSEFGSARISDGEFEEGGKK